MTREFAVSWSVDDPAENQPELGLEIISGLGMPPVEFINLAAALGCHTVSMSSGPLHRENPYRFPAWSMRTDPTLRRDVRAAAADAGIRIVAGEYFLAASGRSVEDQAADMDVLCEIGAERLVLINLDGDPARARDQCACFAAMAADRGVGALLEYLPGDGAVRDLSSALEAVRASGSREFGVVVDAMHFYSSGSSACELAAADPARIGHVQLCDLPTGTTGAGTGYGSQALNDRLPPGQGQLPLADFVMAIPGTATIGLELPMMSRAQAGTSLPDLLRPAVESGRRLLAARRG